jgi:hypothetical protein
MLRNSIRPILGREAMHTGVTADTAGERVIIKEETDIAEERVTGDTGDIEQKASGV